jgi:uncharacterized membrane protein (UPF0127 family)
VKWWAAALAAVALVACSDDEPPAPAIVDALDTAQPAGDPFDGSTVTEIRVGDATMEVVIADSASERSHGLRSSPDPDPYDGMLFVWNGDTDSRFTMDGVPDDLDIAWFDRTGRRVGGAELAACPSGEGCPTYGPDGSYRFALETPAGRLPHGDLGG